MLSFIYPIQCWQRTVGFIVYISIVFILYDISLCVYDQGDLGLFF